VCLLRILATSDLARGLLPDALARIDRFNPVFHQTLILEEAVHEASPQEILDGRADFALINLPIDTDGLRVHWCGQAPCLLALPASHPLAAQEGAVQFDDIPPADIITLLGRYRMRYRLTNSLAQATARHRRRHIEVGSQQTLLAMVRAGMGMGLVDPFSTQGGGLDGIVMRPVQPEIAYRIGVVSLLTHELPEGAQRLIRGLRTHVQAVVPQFVDTDLNGVQHQTPESTGTLHLA